MTAAATPAGSTVRSGTTSALPGPSLVSWEWQMYGACRGDDAELFFHPWGERDPSRTRRDEAAKAICSRCPVLARCREYVLSTNEAYGVWGGLSESDREAIGARRAS